ncbi:MAG: ABC transporter substrate-binding protein [Bdellovibrionota bacterium]
MKRFFFTVLAAISLWLPVSAQATAGTPTDLLKERDTNIRSFLKANPLPLPAPKRSKIEEDLNSLFDYETIAISSLGAHKQKATPKQLQEYIRVFSQVTRNNSSSEDALKHFLQSQIRYEGEAKGPNGATVVKTVIIKNNEEITVDYFFENTKSGWRIVNYVLDDVDLIENYRSSFGKIISEKGFDELISKLKEKLKKKD